MNRSLPRCDRVGLTVAIVVITSLLPIRARGQDDPQSPSPWYINNVLSTSLTTPGAAFQIPLGETVAVRGTIFETDGSPAAGAEVWAASLFAEPPLRELVFTDSQGNFTLNLKPLRGKAERWSLSAYKGAARADIKGSQDWIKQRNPKQPEVVTARLFPREVMHCRILTSEDEQPIAGARLFLGDGRVMISDDGGLITIGGLEQRSHPVVVVAKGRYRRRVLFDNTLRPDGKLNIYLPKAGRIEGNVVDENDSPIPHAWIDVPGSGRALTLDGRCIVANEKGEFTWDGVRFDRVLRYIRAGAEGYKTETIRRLTVTREQPTTKVRFRLRRSDDSAGAAAKLDQPKNATAKRSDPASTLARRDLSGTVTGPDGKPVQGALVRWGATMYEDIQREQRSGTDGSFRLASVPDRVGYVTVIADSLAPEFVRVEEGETSMTVSLRRGVRIGGQVVNHSGDPIQDVHVVPVIASPDPSLCNPYWISQRGGRTDSEGRFLIEDLPHLGVALDFMHSEMSDKRNQVLAVGETDHVVKLSSRGGFRGRVVDPQGDPVSDFRVTIDFPRDKQPNDLTRGFSIVYRAIGNSYTDEEGKFAWGDEVTPGAVYRVTVTANGFGKSIKDRVRATTVDQLSGDHEHLFALPPSSSFSVRALDASNGRPIDGARITLIDAHPRLDDSRFSWNSDEIGSPVRITDDQGMATFDSISSHQGTVAAQASGYGSTRFGWRGGEKGFEVRLVPEAIIHVSARSAGGAAIDQLYSSIEGPGQVHHWDPSSDQNPGQFRFTGLEGGLYKFTLRDERRQLHTDQWQVSPGQTLRVDLIVDPKSGEVTSSEESRTGTAAAKDVKTSIESTAS